MGGSPVCEGKGIKGSGGRHYFVGRSVGIRGNLSAASEEIVFQAPANAEGPSTPTSDSTAAISEPQPQPPSAFDVDVDVDVDSGVVHDVDRVDLDCRWIVLDDDPPGAQIRTTYDPLRQSLTTELVSDWVNNSFQLARADGEFLAGSGPWRLVWDMKADLHYFVSVVLQTSAGDRTLYYTPSDFDLLGNGLSIHHGLGVGSVDDRWHTHDRHLDQDLQHAQPGLLLEGIRSIIIRGCVQVDDILLDFAP